MKRLDGYGMRLMWVGFVVAVVLAGSKSVKADFTFGTAINLGLTVNSSHTDGKPIVTADALSLFFFSNRPGGQGGHDIWVTTRATTEDDWGKPVNIGSTVNSSVDDWAPSISPDGLCLYFTSDRPGGTGNQDLWMTTRPTVNDPWSPPVNLGENVNSPFADSGPSISPDGLILFFDSGRPGGTGARDLWVMSRETTNDLWAEPVNLGRTVNTLSWDVAPNISSNGLVLFFMSDRPGGYGDFDAWVTVRTTIDGAWRSPANLGPTVNSEFLDGISSLSADGFTYFFSSARPGGFGDQDLWKVPILPVVDLNSDGIVDSADMCIMVEHWGENSRLCDIGPTPLGDGIVDAQDLIVLAEHLFEEIPMPFELVAYWKLDEQEGDIASDSAGDNTGLLHGGPPWRSSEGKRDGALEFDGNNDYVSTGFVLNPSLGTFSVFVWVKGGAPRQVIISQLDGIGTGEAWLGLDAQGANLMTGLVPPPLGRTKPEPLISESIITDGQWHHVGFVCDGAYRFLYVDGIEVARDTSILTEALMSSNGGLYIGSGKNLDVGTFFSGLIDDIRIYNVALSAEEIAALAQ